MSTQPRAEPASRRSVRRQKILILYLANSTPDSQTIGWAIYDGTGTETPSFAVDEAPPYASVLEAMKDGWRVIQFPQLNLRQGRDLETDYLDWEFVLEKLEEMELDQ